ncbi:hypothetical protein ACFLU6_16395, partial [Acidobacteriota bacterium]
ISLSPWRSGGRERDESAVIDMERLFRWGQTDIQERMIRAQADLLKGLRLDGIDEAEGVPFERGALMSDLIQLLEDQLSQISGRTFSWFSRFLLNLPVYFYLVLFVTLLLYPVFLVLKTWSLMELPDLGSILTLDNVKVSIIGFVGYYIMMTIYVVRRQRDRVRKEISSLAGQFAACAREILLEAAGLPLTRFAETFNRLEERLERLGQ